MQVFNLRHWYGHEYCDHYQWSVVPKNLHYHYFGNELLTNHSWSLSWEWIWPDTFVIIILVTKYMTKIHYHYPGNGISSFWWSISPIRDHYQIFNLVTKKSRFSVSLAQKRFFWYVFCIKLWTFDYPNVRFWTFLSFLFVCCLLTLLNVLHWECLLWDL